MIYYLQLNPLSGQNDVSRPVNHSVETFFKYNKVFGCGLKGIPVYV